MIDTAKTFSPFSRISIGSMASRIGSVAAPFIFLLDDYGTWIPLML